MDCDSDGDIDVSSEEGIKWKIFINASLIGLVCLWIKYEYVKKTDRIKKLHEIPQYLRNENISTNYADISNVKLDEHVSKLLLKPPSKHPYKIISKKKFDYYQAAHTLSWKFIDNYMKLLFDIESPGFFIEAGALDGEVLSNTLWLEMEKGWKGLLVEPDPASYLALMKKNRKAWTINACLSTLPYPKLSNFKSSRPAFYNSYTGKDKNWLYRGHSYNMEVNDNRDKDYSNYYNYDFSMVLCLPVGHILKTLNVTVVDFFSLDIEGGELEVLELFPWDTIKLRALVVEYGNRERSKEELIRLMTFKGYSLIASSDNEDYFFVLKSEEKLLQNVKQRVIDDNYA